MIVFDNASVPLRDVLMKVAELEPVCFCEFIRQGAVGAVLVEIAGSTVGSELIKHFIIDCDSPTAIARVADGQRDVAAEHVTEAMACLPASDIECGSGNAADKPLLETKTVLDSYLAHVVFDYACSKKRFSGKAATAG